MRFFSLLLMILYGWVSIQASDREDTAPMHSDQARGFGLDQIPYFSFDEFTGTVSAKIGGVGNGQLVISPSYRSLNRQRPGAYSNSERFLQDGLFGRSWHGGFGKLIVENHLRHCQEIGSDPNYCHDFNSQWASVTFVSGQGRSVDFSRDLTFVQHPYGNVQPNEIEQSAQQGDEDWIDAWGPDRFEDDFMRSDGAKYSLWLPGRQSDIHFIDSNLNRITREITIDANYQPVYGNFIKLDRDGTKTIFQKAPNIIPKSGGTEIEGAEVWVPVEIIAPNGRKTTLEYLDLSHMYPDGNYQVNSQFPERIYDHGRERYLQLHYENNTIPEFSLVANSLATTPNRNVRINNLLDSKRLVSKISIHRNTSNPQLMETKNLVEFDYVRISGVPNQNGVYLKQTRKIIDDALPANKRYMPTTIDYELQESNGPNTYDAFVVKAITGARGNRVNLEFELVDMNIQYPFPPGCRTSTDGNCGNDPQDRPAIWRVSAVEYMGARWEWSARFDSSVSFEYEGGDEPLAKPNDQYRLLEVAVREVNDTLRAEKLVHDPANPADDYVDLSRQVRKTWYLMEPSGRTHPQLLPRNLGRPLGQEVTYRWKPLKFVKDNLTPKENEIHESKKRAEWVHGELRPDASSSLSEERLARIGGSKNKGWKLLDVVIQKERHRTDDNFWNVKDTYYDWDVAFDLPTSTESYVIKRERPSPNQDYETTFISTQKSITEMTYEHRHQVIQGSQTMNPNLMDASQESFVLGLVTKTEVKRVENSGQIHQVNHNLKHYRNDLPLVDWEQVWESANSSKYRLYIYFLENESADSPNFGLLREVVTTSQDPRGHEPFFTGRYEPNRSQKTLEYQYGLPTRVILPGPSTQGIPNILNTYNILGQLVSGTQNQMTVTRSFDYLNRQTMQEVPGGDAPQINIYPDASLYAHEGQILPANTEFHSTQFQGVDEFRKTTRFTDIFNREIRAEVVISLGNGQPITRPNGRMDYSPLGEILSNTHPNGSKHFRRFDVFGRELETLVLDSQNNVERFQRFSYSRSIFNNDAVAQTLKHVYDNLDGIENAKTIILEEVQDSFQRPVLRKINNQPMEYQNSTDFHGRQVTSILPHGDPSRALTTVTNWEGNQVSIQSPEYDGPITSSYNVYSELEGQGSPEFDTERILDSRGQLLEEHVHLDAGSFQIIDYEYDYDHHFVLRAEVIDGPYLVNAVEDLDAMNRMTKTTVFIPEVKLGPVQTSPLHLVPYGAATPSFSWTTADENITHFRVELKRADETLWSTNTPQTTVSIPWDLLEVNQEYTWRVMAFYGLPHLEVSQWSEASFTPVPPQNQNGNSNVWVVATRPGNNFPNYAFGDQVQLRIQSNVPNATVYIWRDKDGRTELLGEPLPHGINQTDENGNLEVSFTYDQVGFAGYYSREFFTVGDPMNPPSNIIPDYVLRPQSLDECYENPVLHSLAKSLSAPAHFGTVTVGETSTGSRSVLNDGPYGSCLEINIQENDIRFEWFNVNAQGQVDFSQPSQHFSSGNVFKDRQGAASPDKLTRREIAWIEERFHPQTDTGELMRAMLRITYKPGGPTPTNGDCAGEDCIDSYASGIADNANFEQPYLRHGLRPGKPSLEYTGQFSGKLPLGKWLKGSVRNYSFFNPDPNVSFRGNIAVRYPWRIIRGDDPPFPLPCVGDGPVKMTTFKIDPGETHNFNLEYIGDETGYRDEDRIAMTVWRMVEDSTTDPTFNDPDPDDNDVLLPIMCLPIEVEITDEEAYVSLVGGSPFLIEPTAIGDDTRTEVELRLETNAYGKQVFSIQGDGVLSDVSVEGFTHWGSARANNLGSIAVKTDRDTSANLTLDFLDNRGSYEEIDWPSQHIPTLVQGRPRLRSMEQMLDFGEIMPGEAVHLPFTIVNLSKYQRLSGRMVAPYAKEEGTSPGTRNEIHTPFTFATSNGDYFVAKTFEDMIGQGEGPYEWDPSDAVARSKHQATVRFQTDQPGTYEGFIEVLLCQDPNSSCAPYEGEIITLAVRGTVIDPNATQRLAEEGRSYITGIIETDYSQNGTLSQLTTPSGFVADYQYIQGGLQKNLQVSTPHGQSFEVVKIHNASKDHAYSPSGQPLHFRNPGLLGNRWTDSIRRYDDFGRMSVSALTYASGNPFDPETSTIYHLADQFHFDLYGNITGYRVNDLNTTNQSISLEYDPLNRLSYFGHSLEGDIHYHYDDFGNLWDKVSSVAGVTSQNQTYNGKNQNLNHTYDRNGRMVHDGELYYAYNAQGRIARVTDENGALVAQYLFGPDGNRLRSFSGEETAYAIKTNNRLIEEITVDGQGQTKVELPQYFNGEKHGYFTMIDGILDRYQLVHKDHLGSPVLTLANNQLNLAKFSPFGVMYRGEGTVSNHCGFTNHERDPETGNIFMVNRFMNPDRARFLKPDPAFDFNLFNPSTLNFYQYTHNNPVNFVDPLGLAAQNAEEDNEEDEFVLVSEQNDLEKIIYGDDSKKLEKLNEKLREMKESLKNGEITEEEYEISRRRIITQVDMKIASRKTVEKLAQDVVGPSKKIIKKGVYKTAKNETKKGLVEKAIETLKRLWGQDDSDSQQTDSPEPSDKEDDTTSP